MASSQLSVFVSSRMEELAPERLAVKAALEELEIDGWVFEKDAGARPETIQETYLEEVERSDLYIGLFWRGYGDYTIEEFNYARDHGKDCLLYEKRTDIDGQRDQRLEMWLAEIGDVTKGPTRKWFNTPQELKEFVKQDVASWQARIVRRYKVAGAPQVYQPPQVAEGKTRKDLSTLIDRVEQHWIKGVLEKSVHHQFFIELGKEKMDEAITHPWEAVLGLPNQTDEAPTYGKITDSFKDVGRFLLILGQPGSGKTITLLHLARDLIAEARKNPGEPIPTVFNLSSWSNKGESIADWMVRELTEKYKVSNKIGRAWLDQHLLLPLLDGLDEVRPDLQDDCVRAINNFLRECESGLVVCSRLQEYMSLPVRLELNGAICLQPLSLQQVEDYLDKAGSSLAALKQALKGDSNLCELIQTPLMLSIISLAYEHAPLHSLESKSGETVESLRADVFNTYIERMMERKGKSGRVYSKENLNGWLGWLARQMKSHSQSMFLIEQLQANWLATRRQRFFYVLCSRLLGGLFVGFGFGLAIGLIHYDVYGTAGTGTALLLWLGSIGTGLVLGLVSVLITYLKELLNEKVAFYRRLTGLRRSLADIGVYALTWLPLAGLPMLVSGGIDSLEFILFLGPIAGLLHWFFFEARSERHRVGADITTVETLKWSWKGALKSALKATVVVILLFVPVSFFFVIQTAVETGSWAEGLLFGASQLVMSVLVYGILGGIIGFLFGGFKESIVEKKTKPNQGIRLTVRNATVTGVTIGLLSGTVISLLSFLSDYVSGTELFVSEKILTLTEVSLFIGWSVAFRNGIYDAIKHYTLRAILVSSKYIPRNYIKVLNYAVGLIMLQRVGGGYIFIHRTLLEHYAATYGMDNQALVKS